MMPSESDDFSDQDKTEYITSKFERFKNHIMASVEMISYKSHILNTFYTENSSEHYLCNLRGILKCFVLSFYNSLVLYGFYFSSTDKTLVFKMLYMIILLVSYMMTLFAIKSNQTVQLKYVQLISNWICLIYFCYNVHMHIVSYSIIDIIYSPIIPMNILLFSNLQLDFHLLIIIFIISSGFVFYQAREFENSLNMLFKINQNKERILNEIKKLPVFEFSPLDYTIFYSVLSLLPGILFISVYLYSINNIRRRSSLIRLNECLEKRRKLNLIMRKQLKYINMIVPNMIQDEFWKHRNERKIGSWLYTRFFDKVTILVSDIIGLTLAFHGNNPASYTNFLSEILYKFDKLCISSNCERIGLNNHGYYCISGCPNPRDDHVISCIELGLEMLRTIRRYNQEYKHPVKIRIGIHTGKVAAGIIGFNRFKFDIYSSDINIARILEKNCKPDHIHITENVCHQIKQIYPYLEGSVLNIDPNLCISLKTIRTYYIDSEKIFRVQYRSFIDTSTYDESNRFHDFMQPRVSKSYRSISDLSSMDTASFANYERAPRHNSFCQLDINKAFSDIAFIKLLKSDPSKLIGAFSNLPINSLTLWFKDAEIEWSYRNFDVVQISDGTVDSLKCSGFVDSVACFIYSVFYYLVIVAVVESDIYVWLLILSGLFLKFLIIILSLWFFLFTHNKNPIMKTFSETYRIARYFIVIYQTTFPIIINLSFFKCDYIFNNVHKTMAYFTAIYFSLLFMPLYTCCNIWYNFLVLSINLVMTLLLLFRSSCSLETYSTKYSFESKCLKHQNVTSLVYYSNIRMSYTLQVILLFIVILMIIRELEINKRLWYFIYRESLLIKSDVDKLEFETNELLFNIIPKFVIENNHLDLSKALKEVNCSSTKLRVGVATIFISKLREFSTKEDCKKTLRSLHEIISLIDSLIVSKFYSQLVKVKTVSESYVIASGLNNKEDGLFHQEINDSENEDPHFSVLMYFCLEIIELIKKFNTHLSKNTDCLELKIGYTIGKVTFGVLNVSRLYFDIFGNAVNISKFLSLKAESWSIKVTQYSMYFLKSKFRFKYTGNIKIDQNNSFNSYVCLGIKQHRASEKSILSTTITESRMTIEKMDTEIMDKSMVEDLVC